MTSIWTTVTVRNYSFDAVAVAISLPGVKYPEISSFYCRIIVIIIVIILLVV